MPREKATYAQIYDYVVEYYNIKVGGNEIAEAKEKAGLKLGQAHNRLDPERRSTHSPQESIDAIHAAFKHFGIMPFVAVLLMSFLQCSANAKPPPPIVWHFGARTIRIFYGDLKLYAVKDSDLHTWAGPTTDGSMQFFVADGDDQAVSNKYVKINGITATVHFRCDYKHVIDLADDGSFAITGPGVCNITISLAGKNATMHFTVVALPLKNGMTEDQVIQAIGLPDKRTDQFLEWPTKNYVYDGIWYSNDGEQAEGTYIEHWKYNGRPLTIVSFRDHSLEGCLESSWDHIQMYDRL